MDCVRSLIFTFSSIFRVVIYCAFVKRAIFASLTFFGAIYLSLNLIEINSVSTRSIDLHGERQDYSFFFQFLRGSQCLVNKAFVLLLPTMSHAIAFTPFFLLICDGGDKITKAYGDLDGAIYSITWYMGPLKIQRYMVPMMVAAQQPLLIKGLFTLHCTRETFKKVRSFATMVGSASF